MLLAKEDEEEEDEEKGGKGENEEEKPGAMETGGVRRDPMDRRSRMASDAGAAGPLRGMAMVVTSVTGGCGWSEEVEVLHNECGVRQCNPKTKSPKR